MTRNLSQITSWQAVPGAAAVLAYACTASVFVGNGMDSFQDFLTRRTLGLEARLRSWAAVFRFTGAVLLAVVSRRSYNSATREVMARQIYFTAWQIIFGYALFAAVFSLVITQVIASAAREVGLYEYALELTIRAVVLEIVPLVTTLFVALRTGAAISTEVALMRIRNELGAMEAAGIDPFTLELLPRVIGGTVSVLTLTAIGVIVSLLCAHFVVTGYQPWNAPPGALRLVIAKVLDGQAMILLWGKTLLFGLAVTVIPISESVAAPRKVFFAPIAVLHGMVRLFFAIMLIQTAGLALRYL